MPPQNPFKLTNSERQTQEQQVTLLRALAAQSATPPDIESLFQQVPLPPVFTAPTPRPLPDIQTLLQTVPGPQLQPLPVTPAVPETPTLTPTDTQKLMALVGALTAPEYAWAFLSAPGQAQQALQREEEERSFRRFQLELQRHSTELQRVSATNQQELQLYQSRVTEAYERFRALVSSITAQNEHELQARQAEWQSAVQRVAAEAQQQLEKTKVSIARREYLLSNLLTNTVFRSALADMTPEQAAMLGQYFGVVLPPELIQSLGTAGDVTAMRLQSQLVAKQVEAIAADIGMKRLEAEKLRMELENLPEQLSLGQKLTAAQIAYLQAQATKEYAEAQALRARASQTAGAGGVTSKTMQDVLKMQISSLEKTMDTMQSVANGKVTQELTAMYGMNLRMEKPPLAVTQYLYAMTSVLGIQRDLYIRTLAGSPLVTEQDRRAYQYYQQRAKELAQEIVRGMQSGPPDAQNNFKYWGTIAFGLSHTYARNLAIDVTGAEGLFGPSASPTPPSPSTRTPAAPVTPAPQKPAMGILGEPAKPLQEFLQIGKPQPVIEPPRPPSRQPAVPQTLPFRSDVTLPAWGMPSVTPRVDLFQDPTFQLLGQLGTLGNLLGLPTASAIGTGGWSSLFPPSQAKPAPPPARRPPIRKKIQVPTEPGRAGYERRFAL